MPGQTNPLLFLKTLKIGSINEVLNVVYGARKGKHVGGIGEFGLVGENAPMCNPAWNNTELKTQEKIWDLGAFMVKESLCADDFTETVVQFSMGAGTSKADMTSDDLLNLIVEPRLTLAIEKGVWRVLWFGDKDAANVSGGGVITDGLDVKFFNSFDGLFKRLYAIAPTGSVQNVPIAANAAATYEAQLDGIFTAGVPKQVFDRMIYKADMKLRQQSSKIMLCTQSMADALAWDLKENNKGSDLQWQALFDGLVYATIYNGQKLLSLPIWDEQIRAFEDNGATWKDPHRVVFADKETLLAGVEGTDLMAQLDIWFSKDTQTNKILAREEMGTMVWEDNLTMFAY